MKLICALFVALSISAEHRICKRKATVPAGAFIPEQPVKLATDNLNNNVIPVPSNVKIEVHNGGNKNSKDIPGPVNVQTDKINDNKLKYYIPEAPPAVIQPIVENKPKSCENIRGKKYSAPDTPSKEGDSCNRVAKGLTHNWCECTDETAVFTCNASTGKVTIARCQSGTICKNVGGGSDAVNCLWR